MQDKINNLIKNIEDYFNRSKGKKAIIGISGGKDSTVAATLCVQALGKENVIGILMPNGIDSLKDDSISDGKHICEHLGIKYHIIDIHKAYFETQIAVENMLYCINNCDINSSLSKQAKINLAPRIRMATLYAVSQSIEGGRVINTTNACEKFVGYGTLFGDTVGDLAILQNLTVSQIYEIGDYLKIPYDLVHKIPSDGLTGKSDEEVLGVSYEAIEAFMRHSGLIDGDFKDFKQLTIEEWNIINELHNKSRFKREMINLPSC